MSNFSFLQTIPAYALFAPRLRGSRENLCLRPGPVRCGLPQGAGAGGEVGVRRGQHHAHALQGQPAIPHP